MSTEAIQRDWLRLQDFWRIDIREHARRQDEQFQMMLNSLEPRLGPIKGKRILDIGCGRSYPFALLFNSLGNQVTGIDILYIGANEPLVLRYPRILMHNGLKSLAEELLYKLSLKEKAYYQALEKVAAFPLTTQGITFERMSAENMNFPDETFDIVVSVASFEHIANVPQAVSELSRVMKRGAIAYVIIHLFTSPSGGHHFNWPNPDKVPPWDHLRQRKLPLTIYLNKMRKHEYLEVFGRGKLDVLEVLDIGRGEGRELLSAEIRAELSGYSDDELLQRAIAIVARQR